VNRKLKLSLICFLFVVLASHSFAEVDLTELVENIHPAVATVITYDKNKNPLGQGSGFFIDANGHLITNYHVLAGASHAEVRTYDGKRYLIKSVIGENKKMDLIKVLVDIPRSSVQWIEATRILPSVAERVVVIGSPMGLEQTVSEGIVSSVREIPEIGKILQISASISSGSSGGPVVNMKEKVIGVVSFYLIKGQNLNFAVLAQYFIDLKPFKTTKTISEWTYRVDQKTLRKKPQKSRLFVRIEPEGARIRILNIKPKFYQGIVLKSGSYHIEVSADGYKMKKIWIKIKPKEDKSLKISLKKLPHLLSANPDELFSMGFDYAKKGENKKAIEAYKQAIRIDPDDAMAYYNLGVVYHRLSLYREAIEAYKQAIRIDPDDAKVHSSLGVDYGNLGLHRESIEAFKQAIRIDPDDAGAHYNLGVSYGKLGHHREAIEAYKQAILINPDYAEAHLNLGIDYGQLGHHRESIEAFKQAIRIDPDDAKAHYCLGLIYIELRHRGDALEQYKILKTLDKEKANDLFDTIYR